MNVFTNGAAQVNAVTIPLTTQVGMDPMIDVFMNRGSGHVDINFLAQNQRKPRGNFVSQAIKEFLDAIGISGLAIDTTAILWNYKIAENSTRSASTDHEKWTINHGIVIPRRLSVRQGGEATVSADIIAVFDGTNAAIIRGTGSIPSGSQDPASKFTLAKFNWGTTLYDSQSLDIDFGINEIVISANGDTEPTFAAIGDRTIRGTITTHDLSIRNVITPDGDIDKAIFFLRKIAEGGTRVADATEEHISLTMTEAYAHIGSSTASQNQPATQEVIFTANYDGTNAPLVIDTTAAIAAAA